MKRVTHVLTECGLREWPSHMRAEDREFYLNRGTMIHAATVLHDKGTLDWDTLDPRIIGFIRGWQKFRCEIGGMIEAMELKVVNKRLGYRGTLDRVLSHCGVHPRGLFLLDVKTNDASTDTRLQTMAYAMAWGKYGKKCKRGAVSLFDTGKYKVEVYDNDISDRAGWMACLVLYGWKLRNGLIKEKA